ncbi:MAG: hypothetical protein KME50_34810 [Nostoc desertorum CM1-VF14]|jgi:hypothetical protein|nr:hypothetical protein [Nostoc desertorum CM1-VF14]
MERQNFIASTITYDVAGNLITEKTDNNSDREVDTVNTHTYKLTFESSDSDGDGKGDEITICTYDEGSKETSSSC